jgi:predicted RNase H-like HicB family nuclease
MNSTYTALIQRDGDWWIGWVKEISGVNSQGRNREELVENLRSALEEALQMNREDAEVAASGQSVSTSFVAT